MANSFFKFKQFTIHQDQCGMKVTTDGCLFGALVAEHIRETVAPDKTLDIGTGTGLLSLMLAQVGNGRIDALEIDGQAYTQARDNFEASPWSERLRASNISFQHFLKDRILPLPNPERTARHFDLYDLIVCNPPFFSNHLTGKHKTKNNALHDESDLLKILPEGIELLLAQNGICFVLLPAYEMSVLCSDMSRAGLFPQKEIIVYHKKGRPVFRRVIGFGRTEKKRVETERLHIHAGKAPYSERFTALLKPYYLHL